MSFVSSNQAVVTIVGNKVYINGPGEVTISAIQMGDTRYHPAIPQPQVLTVINPVDKDVQVISFEDIPLKVRDDPPFELNASASSGLPIEFKVDYGPAFVDPYGVVILEGVVGTISITAAQGVLLISTLPFQLLRLLLFLPSKDLRFCFRIVLKMVFYILCLSAQTDYFARNSFHEFRFSISDYIFGRIDS